MITNINALRATLQQAIETARTLERLLDRIQDAEVPEYAITEADSLLFSDIGHHLEALANHELSPVEVKS